MVYGFTAKNKRKNFARSGSKSFDCKWRSCTKCNGKLHICTCVKPSIKILPDKVQDKTKEVSRECFRQK